MQKESCNRYFYRLYCSHTSGEETTPTESALPWQRSVKPAMTRCPAHWNHRLQHSWMWCTYIKHADFPPLQSTNMWMHRKVRIASIKRLKTYKWQPTVIKKVKWGLYSGSDDVKMKSHAGIRSTYSPWTAHLIGWLSRWPYTLRISSAHNETCPTALTLGFNQNVAHCLKDKRSLTKSVTEATTWPERKCVALQYLQLGICPFCCSQYSLQLQSILFYESDKKNEASWKEL